MNSNSFTQQAYVQSVGVSPTNYPILSLRDPVNINDINYKIGQFWINTNDIRLWYLNSKSNASGNLVAFWELISTSSVLVSLSDTAGTVVLPSEPSDSPPDNIQLYSSDGSIDIVSDPANFRIDFTVDGGTTTVQQLQGDDGVNVSPIAGIIRTLGNTVANATHAKPLFTINSATNIERFDIQVATATPSTNINLAGIASFNNSQFSVDASGFVSLAGGGEAVDSFQVQATTAPGVNPVVPTINGLVTVNGAVVANHSVVLETRTRALNAYNLEVQYSTTSATTDGTKSGVSHYDSNAFAVDSVGFVTLNTTGVLRTLTGDTGTATPIAGNIQIAGGPGVTTSASGAVVTINSVVFTDITASTLAVDNGYNATAAGTYPLPATATQGELIIVFCDTTGAVVLDAPTNNFIRIGSLITSNGGTATSTLQGDSLTLRYRLSTLTWECTSCIGTWIVA
jgi:hypothetical protein